MLLLAAHTGHGVSLPTSWQKEMRADWLRAKVSNEKEDSVPGRICCSHRPTQWVFNRGFLPAEGHQLRLGATVQVSVPVGPLCVAAPVPEFPHSGDLG